MAQTLTPFVALTFPITISQATILSGNMSAIANLDNRMVLALQVIGKIYELTGQAGTPDYRANHKQLRIDATSFMGAIDIVGDVITPLDRAMAVIAWNAAHTEASLSTDVNALVVQMAALRDTPVQTLRQFLCYLEYLLSITGA